MPFPFVWKVEATASGIPLLFSDSGVVTRVSSNAVISGQCQLSGLCSEDALSSLPHR